MDKIIILNFKSTYKIDLINIKKITKQISIPRSVSSSNLALVKRIVSKYIRQINGFIVSEQRFNRVINNNSYSFSNIIASNTNARSSNRKKIILGAHIESIYGKLQIDATIDAATGIALIIDITNILITYDPYYPISIVFFDGEEAIDGEWADNNTLSGSSYYVNMMNKSELDSLVFIIDLIGGSINNNPIHPFAINKKNLHINNSLYDINNELYPNDQVFTNRISNRIIKDDYVPFMNKNISYVNLIPDVFPVQHHKLDDNYQNVNWKYVNIFGNVLLNYLINYN